MNTTEVETVSPPISFDTHHDDVIHDAKVDFYGRRLATASSDRTIRIFQINENETETLLSILSGHEGPVWQVAWAHPKFGSILASCSYDGSVIIWQEDKQQKSQNPAGTHSTWTKVKIHRAHDSSVNSISFAPHAFGLHLACASSDGKVSILSQVGEDWHSQVISAHSTGCNSVSWAPSAVPSSLFTLNFNALEEKPIPLGPKMIATGGCDNTVKLWKLIEEESEEGVLKEKWAIDATLDYHSDWVRDVCWRPSLGQTGHMLVSCSQDKTVLIWKLNETIKKWESKPLKQQPFADTLWRVSFSEYGHLLAVSCGDNTVTIWRENSDDGNWELAGNVNETVTETSKIEEPLAVAPPPSAPIPEINFTSSNVPNIIPNVGYVKPMSPMIPAPSIPSTNSTPGYQQFNQAYDDYQHALAPNIPKTGQPLMNNEILSTAVIPETTSAEYNVYNYEQPLAQYEPDQQITNYTEVPEEFNKDIGFVTSTSQYEIQSSYDQNQFGAQEQPDQNFYEQPTYDQQQTYNQESYEQYDQQDYNQQVYEQQANGQTSYDQKPYEQQVYEQQDYNQQAYEKTSYDQGTYEQPDQHAFEQVSYDAQYDSQTQNQYEYEQQPALDQSQYETQDPNSNYPEGEINYYQEGEQEPYNSYYQTEISAEPVQEYQQETHQTDYTLQYEVYASSVPNNNDSSGL